MKITDIQLVVYNTKNSTSCQPQVYRGNSISIILKVLLSFQNYVFFIQNNMTNCDHLNNFCSSTIKIILLSSQICVNELKKTHVFDVHFKIDHQNTCNK